MKRFVISLFLVVVMAIIILPSAALAVYVDGAPMRTAVNAERVPGVLIVNIRPDAITSSMKAKQRGGATIQSAAMGIPTLDDLNAKWNLKAYRQLFPGVKAPAAPSASTDLRGYQVLTFDNNVDLDRAAAEYLDNPDVESVEYDYYAYIMRTPNDTYYSIMWEFNDPQDNDIDAPEAWDKTAGDPSIILADTDTGVLYTHPDLISNIWVNPGEDLDSDGVVFDIDDMDGVDNDGNGYIDDVIGYDFVSSGTLVWPGEDGSVKDNDPIDFHGHGTHTSGTIAATMNNATGVASVAGGFGPGEPGCKIMCLRMGYSFNDGGYENGRTHMSYVAEAFRYAADNGAVGINYSFGSSTGGGIEAATDYAINAGLVICAAAGNDNNSSLGYLQARPDVICVASTTNSDRKSSFSNYSTLVDVSAPGSSIRSTVSNHYSAGYATWSGTSMATPHVVGLVGLIKSLNPILGRQDVIDRIVMSTDNIDALNPSYAGLLGSGRINANNALSNIAATNFDATPRMGSAPLSVQFNDSSLNPPTSWLWDFGDGMQSTDQNPQHTFAPGLYDVTLSITSTIGPGHKTRTHYVAALAETLDVHDSTVVSGAPAVIEISAVNNLPIDTIMLPLTATNITQYGFLDSIVTTGCRTEGFDGLTLYDNRFNGQLAMRFTAPSVGQELAPGDGPIARVYFRIKSSAPIGESIDISFPPLGYLSFKVSSFAVSYVPVVNTGSLIFTPMIGDLNADEVYDALDLNELIEMIFFGAPLPNPVGLADLDCDGAIDALDLNYMIELIFYHGPQPCQ